MRIIAGKHKGRLLKSPKGNQTRPTSSRLRETLFNICQNHLEGCLFLDLFAGSGAMGLEAISRGASFSLFVDSSSIAQKCITNNIILCKEQTQCVVWKLSAQNALKKCLEQGKCFDIIYADPPFIKKDQSQSIYDYILDLSANTPLLRSEGHLFIEASANTSLLDRQSYLEKKATRKVGGVQLQHYRKPAPECAQ